MEFLSRFLRGCGTGLLLLFAANLSLASHHSWKMSEVFSNVDGSLQFIEMVSDADNHAQLTCCQLVAGNAMTGIDTGYQFPQNLPSSTTAGKSLLIATAGFEAEYGITPDYIIPEHFLTTGSGDVFYNDTLTWSSLPTDGFSSLKKIGNSQETSPATPKNFSGTQITLEPGSDTTPPVLANLPVEPVPIASNSTVSGTDSRITDVLSAVTCSDDEDTNPTITFDTPTDFPVGQTTPVPVSCTDESGNEAIASISFSVTGFDDTDGDGIANEIDPDDDNDGVLDEDDAFPVDANETTDTDGDGIGNNADTDDDNDGIPDITDGFPLDGNEDKDTDGDGTGNNADGDDDNDGVPDVDDAFPLDSSESVDTDSDGTGNNSDADDDGDGVADSDDAFPLDSEETLDTDGDGVGNNQDQDDDGDGVNDEDDDFPLDPDASEDAVDTDNDGVTDENDNCPDTANPSQLDTDNDGLGNGCDDDDDDDGIPDTEDPNPLTPDIDSDGDGLLDGLDNCPLNENTDQANQDGDTQGDACDNDDDNDGEADTTDAFPFDPDETLDTDNDGIGNNADPDDDNDGIPDVVELANGLDPLSANDAAEDADGDGLSNLTEHEMGKDISADDVPPAITLDSPQYYEASGRRTAISFDNVTAVDAKDGQVVVIPDQTGPFASGVHVIKWTATDAAGNIAAAEQIIEIKPLISLQADQVAAEGNQVRVAIALSGNAAHYPVTINFEISGDIEDSDFSQLNNPVVIPAGNQSAIIFNTMADGITEGDESLVITLTGAENAALGARATHTVTITESNLSPSVWLQVLQDGEQRTRISRAGGTVSITAIASDPNLDDSLSFDWRLSNDALGIGQLVSADVMVTPTELATGRYLAGVTVSDDAGDQKTVTRSQAITVVESLPLLSAGDSDGDGLSDLTEGHKDTDYDGIPDYLDSSEDTAIMSDGTEDRFLETQPGLRIKLGEAAFAGELSVPKVSNEQLAAWAATETGALPTEDLAFIQSADIFDFEIDLLANPGQSAAMVLPLSESIPTGAEYRKYSDQNGWQSFIEDSINSISSAEGPADACPPPGHSSYQPGLVSGALCLQLHIEDGGPNDRDGIANGSIQDPGKIAVADTSPPDLLVPGSLTIESGDAIDASNSDIQNFLASASCVDAVAGELEVADDAPGSFPLGATTSITFSCSDEAGNEVSASASVSVVEPPVVVAPSGSSSGSGCFIATAAYGSWLAPEVRVLRDFRDNHLLTNEPGSVFVSLYYAYSPPLARKIEKSGELAFVTRIMLSPMVYAIKYPIAAAALLFLLPLLPVLRRFRNKRLAV